MAKTKKKATAAKASDSVQEPDANVVEEVEKLSVPVTVENAKDHADTFLLPRDERFKLVNMGGEPQLFDRCSPTFVAEDGTAFHAEFEGECKVHCKLHALKYFAVVYQEKPHAKDEIEEVLA